MTSPTYSARTGWLPCPGGDSTNSHRVGIHNMCKACGAQFAALPDGYIPRHDAPTVQAVIDACEGQP